MRLSRNIEYIRSLENPFNFKCDQKDLLIDKDGRAIIVYQSAIYSPNTTLWIVYGKPKLNKIVKTVEFNITLPYAREENSEKTPLGLMPIAGGIAISLLVRRKLSTNHSI